MNREKVFVAGHRGMVGSALLRQLEADEKTELLTCSRNQLDLSRQSQVEQFFGDHQLDQVYLAAARVGGILANRDFPADFIRENLQIQTNVIDAAYRAGVKRLLFLGSSCIYPRMAPQPISEEALMTGQLESSNEAYAVAKIAGIKMCEAYHRQYGSDFRSVMPTNLYGPFDNFDLESSHVLPALLRKFHQAKKENSSDVTVWGSGEPRREFLHVDDMAEASIRIMQIGSGAFWDAVPEYNSQVNIGCGTDISIAELAQLISEVCGYEGQIVFDRSKPDGTPRKLLDVSRAQAMGWAARITLQEGVKQTYQWMRNWLESEPGLVNGPGSGT